MTEADPIEPAGASLLEPGRNCWRIEQAERAAFVVDAADYFRLARKAMLKAKRQILLIGWDLDTRVRLDHDSDDEAPVTLGPFISWIARRQPQLRVHMLAWGGGAHRFLGRGSTLFRIARWKLAERIHFKLDTNHPRAASHHQKLLVIDDALAFCGGIDITGSRWDRRAHSDDEPGRRRPTTGRRYMPWHDTIMAVDAPAARALGELCRNRWEAATGKRLPAPAPDSDPWPKEMEPHFRNVQVGIARTRGKVKDREEVREIERLFVDMIGRARRFIYAENQYFASRVVAEALMRRLARPDCPEVVLVTPRTGEGWLDDEVMSAARAELVRQLGGCAYANRLRIYHPVTEGGTFIYVHAKVMIVDDLMLRVGSANMNNRSMGLDSECDLVIDANLSGDRAVADRIARIRCDLMAEHLGTSAAAVAEAFERSGSLIETVESLRGEGRTLCPFVREEPDKLGKAVARSEAGDPESACDSFEPMAQRRLAGGLIQMPRSLG